MTDRQTETSPAQAAEALLNAWAQALRDDGKADRTDDSYTTDVKRFVDRHCGAEGRPVADADAR